MSVLPLKQILEDELTIDFRAETDAAGACVFTRDILPLIEDSLCALGALDEARLRDVPETNYLFEPHAHEVANALARIARAAQAHPGVETSLRAVALLHDVGKLLLPPQIWNTTLEKPQDGFKALRRAHGPLGAAYLMGDWAVVEKHVPDHIRACLQGTSPMESLIPPSLRSGFSWGPEQAHRLRASIEQSPFKGKETAFLPLAATGALRHHEPTGSDAAPLAPQSVWLKLLALVEDLSGNMVERPHFHSAGRATHFDAAIAHMRAEGARAHDLGLLEIVAAFGGGNEPERKPPHRSSPALDPGRLDR